MSSGQPFQRHVQNQLLHESGAAVDFDTEITQHPTLSDHLLIISRDLSMFKRMEEERRAQAAHLEFFRLMDASFDLVTLIEVCDGKAWRRYSSKSHMTILGHDPESCNGDESQMVHLFTNSFLRDELPALIAAFEADQIIDGYVGEMALLHADGHEVWFEYRISLDESMPQQFIAVFRDITDRRERQRLEVENARLEVKQRMDEEAVHTISHQLKNRFIALRSRSPSQISLSPHLCGMSRPRVEISRAPTSLSPPCHPSCMSPSLYLLCFMSLARRGLAQSVRGSVQDYAPQLMQDPHNVRETLADLVGQSNGGIRVCLSETVVRMIAHNEYTRTDTEFDLHSELEQLCGVRVALTIDFDVPQRILSDLNLILHSAENLTSNATKYGPDGSPVRLRISALPSRRLRLSVHNDPGEKHAELRERFGTDTSSLFHGGVGVHSHALSSRKGLAIAKKCATLLGGDVSLRFEPTEVVATLDLTYAILPSSLCFPTSTLMASVDDAELVREMDRVRIREMNIDAASSDHVRGGTADEISDFPVYVQQMDPQPSIVLLDQNLDHPISLTEFVKGTDLIRPLRDLGFTGMIVVKSANNSPSDARFYASCGADGVIAKGLSALDMNRQLACILFGVGAPLAEADEAIDAEQFDTLPVALLPTIVENVALITGNLEAAIQDRDQARADSSLHRLRGTCQVAGFRRLEEVCITLRGHTIGTDEWEAEIVNFRSAVQQACDRMTARIG
jgi:signal transduction histidine kinase/HPt (histidine-containing phosphotransfer) domain-containing protein